MQVGIGYSDIPDSAASGKKAAENAVRAAGRQDPCDLVFLFCTTRHDQQALREAVASVVGTDVPIYGGGAVGIITNHTYGYAGYQVGLACLWLDGVRCDVALDGDLPAGEEEGGFRLGRELARLGVTPDASTLLLYNAMPRNDVVMRMMMATRIMAGLEKALGYLPPLHGAGLMGDHACSPCGQFVGKETSADGRYAQAFLFGDDIRIDSAVMHGCRPASPYYTVTRADGPTILEINHKPALDFMGDLLGSAVSPEQYPFFLLFGINYGERDEYEEDNYASRLCLAIDRERGGIVMFEPDMVEGTEFQVMCRSFDLAYMKPRIEALFAGLDGREPVFGMYFDCAGRCAGFGGTDMEDALALQQAVAGRVPVLGVYTGVEIAPIFGRPRSLDWTGVFCLFSQEGSKVYPQPAHADSTGEAGHPPLKAALHLELSERNLAKILSLDTLAIALRYELELKRRGFQLLSELTLSLRWKKNDTSPFAWVAERINATLNMRKTLILMADEAGKFVPVAHQGFTAEELGRPVAMPREMILHPVVVTGEDSPDRFAALRSAYNLPFFVSVPVSMQGETSALLLTGRSQEQPPYFLRLGQGDTEILQAIAGLLGAVGMRRRLSDMTRKAETDNLTGLWNRNAFQGMVEGGLRTMRKKAGAFMMIDVDYFKSVNDLYGHLTGDAVLLACANAMRNVLRDSDSICRQGGDEFAVFCRGITNGAVAAKKAAQIRAAWKNIVPREGVPPITASIGIALAPQHGTSFQELYANADAALYEAKKRGRDCLVVFDS